MVTNDRRFFWILEAVLGVLVLLTIAVMFSGKGEKDKIAVIVRNSDAEKWTQFISGVKTAASDAGADIVIASTGGFSTLADEGALIQQEIRSGADALILQPVPGEDGRPADGKYHPVAFPSNSAVAMSWDKKLAYDVGVKWAQEAKASPEKICIWSSAFKSCRQARNTSMISPGWTSPTGPFVRTDTAAMI